ncbi:hypothetical protein J3E69DRAFT_331638, partial [Trichoderma sp. SZMC 28015]
MSWHHVFVIGNISRRVCGLHLCQGVPRISFRPIKPLHMRNEDCHASSYSGPSIFQPHFTIAEAKPSSTSTSIDRRKHGANLRQLAASGVGYTCSLSNGVRRDF